MLETYKTYKVFKRKSLPSKVSNVLFYFFFRCFVLFRLFGMFIFSALQSKIPFCCHRPWEDEQRCQNYRRRPDIIDTWSQILAESVNLNKSLPLASSFLRQKQVRQSYGSPWKHRPDSSVRSRWILALHLAPKSFTQHSLAHKVSLVIPCNNPAVYLFIFLLWIRNWMWTWTTSNLPSRRQLSRVYFVNKEAR